MVGHPSISFLYRPCGLTLWYGPLPLFHAVYCAQQTKDTPDGCNFSLGLLVREDPPPTETDRLDGRRLASPFQGQRPSAPPQPSPTTSRGTMV